MVKLSLKWAIWILREQNQINQLLVRTLHQPIVLNFSRNRKLQARITSGIVPNANSSYRLKNRCKSTKPQKFSLFVSRDLRGSSTTKKNIIFQSIFQSMTSISLPILSTANCHLATLMMKIWPTWRQKIKRGQSYTIFSVLQTTLGGLEEAIIQLIASNNFLIQTPNYRPMVRLR